VCPEVESIFHTDQVDGDADAVSGSPNRSFQHGFDAQFPADPSGIARLPFEAKDYAGRSDPQAFDPRKHADQFLSQSITEIFILGVCGLVHEGHHCHCRTLGDGDDKAVAPLWNCFDETWRVGRIAQRVAQTADGGIQCYFEIDKRVRRPKPLAQVFAGHDFTGTLHERGEHLKRLLPEGDRHSPLQQPATFQIDFKCSEAHVHGCRSFLLSVSCLSTFWSHGSHCSIRNRS